MAQKITSGLLKGLTIQAPTGSTTRPTTAKVLEAILDSMAPYWQDSKVLDGFAGSGGNGIAALSRGAASVVFVERDRQALQVLDQNIKKVRTRLGPASHQIDLWRLDMEHIPLLSQHLAAYKFDIIWLDPPYQGAASVLRHMMPVLIDHLAPGGFIILETGSEPLPWINDLNLVLEKEKHYGKTVVRVWQCLSP